MQTQIPRLVACLFVTSLPNRWPLASNSSCRISHSKWRWFWIIQLTLFSNLFAKINALQPNRSPENVLNKWVSSLRTLMLFWNNLEWFCAPNCLSRPFNSKRKQLTLKGFITNNEHPVNQGEIVKRNLILFFCFVIYYVNDLSNCFLFVLFLFPPAFIISTVQVQKKHTTEWNRLIFWSFCIYAHDSMATSINKSKIFISENHWGWGTWNREKRNI